MLLIDILWENMATESSENVVNDFAVVSDGGNQENAAQVYFKVILSMLLKSVLIFCFIRLHD